MKTRSIRKTTLFFSLLFISGVSAWCQPQTFAYPSPQACGDPVDTLNGETSYYNGDGTTITCTDIKSQDGMRYECVELVRRYYRIVNQCGVGQACNTAHWTGDAASYYPSAVQFGLEQHQNQHDTSMPQIGDIIGYAGQDAGHVAIIKNIVTWTQPNTWLVYVIEENVAPYATALPLFLSRDATTGFYTLTDNTLTNPFPSVSLGYPPKWVSRIGKYYSIQGWMRVPGLNSGSWPTQDHDNRRSNESGLAGPAAAAAPRLIYDAGSPILDELVMTSDNKLVLGGYSNQVVANHVVAIDAAGNAAWPAPFTLLQNNNESPIGFTVDSLGRIYIATHDWPDIPGPVSVHLYSLLPNGTSAPNWPISFFPAMYQPPAIAGDGTVYQMDELTYLRALRPVDGSVVWQQHLAGFSQGAIALDSSGNLYTGTDGGRYGSNGFWSFSPSGALRWSLLSDNLGTPVISLSDVIYVASQTGTVYAYTPSGTLLPGWPFSSGASPPPDSQQDPLAVGGSGTVYLKTVSGVFAINPNGTQKWKYSPGGDGSLSPVVVLDKDENAYFAFGNTVYSLTPTGAFRWSVPLATPGRLYIGAPGILYTISGNQQLYAIGQ